MNFKNEDLIELFHSPPVSSEPLIVQTIQYLIVFFMSLWLSSPQEITETYWQIYAAKFLHKHELFSSIRSIDWRCTS